MTKHLTTWGAVVVCALLVAIVALVCVGWYATLRAMEFEDRKAHQQETAAIKALLDYQAERKQ